MIALETRLAVQDFVTQFQRRLDRFEPLADLLTADVTFSNGAIEIRGRDAFERHFAQRPDRQGVSVRHAWLNLTVRGAGEALEASYLVQAFHGARAAPTQLASLHVGDAIDHLVWEGDHLLLAASRFASALKWTAEPALADHVLQAGR
jgi:SnoaL-like domain